MPRLSLCLTCATALLGLLPSSGATGYYGPNEYLAGGAKGLVEAPEFYWELEVKRLAADFREGEKWSVTRRPVGWEAAEPDEKMRVLEKSTEEGEEKDFADALASGRLKPGDPTAARTQHLAARKFLETLDPKAPAGTPPEEFPSEFADYHRGAVAYRLGPAHWDAAKAAWEKLLARPAPERHYRTVWATFMLGKIAMKRDQPEGAGWFRQVRELVKSGFGDSIGMAAESHGWEARCEWRTGHPEKAAPIYLRQLALGDESAVVSLKALIPDRAIEEGLASYRPLPGGPEEGTTAAASETEKQLRAAAADPLLRRLVTVHILATAASEGALQDEPGRAPRRSVRWLRILQEARIAAMEDAEYLGWIAYTTGNYAAASQWLALAKPDGPASCWLRAKLQRRAGQLEAAVASMAQAFRSLRSASDYTHWRPPQPAEGSSPDDPFPDPPDGLTFKKAAGGNLGALRLERTDFIGALSAFLQAGLWADAAFVAERVLYLDELKKFVDSLAAAEGEADEQRRSLRHLLGRRYVREDRYVEAAIYLPAPYADVLAKYAQALQDGANEKLPKLRRARAWFAAAWTARVDGLELMGTEVAPDGFITEGAFPNSDIVGERLSGVLKPEATDIPEAKPEKPVPISARPAAQERERLRKNRVNPEIRFHYRIIAAALAMRAAALLPDNSEELADVINRAGWWVRDRDQKLADRYFQELSRRASKTELGRTLLQKKWFADERGPWSEEEGAAPRPTKKP